MLRWADSETTGADIEKVLWHIRQRLAAYLGQTAETYRGALRVVDRSVIVAPRLPCGPGILPKDSGRQGGHEGPMQLPT